MEQIHIRLGQNLKAIRKMRELSLDQMSEMTGVSKAMLAQIERGESSPSISTIWKIANGLRLTFSTLIQETRPAVSVVRQSEVPPLSSEDGKFRAYPLHPFDPHQHLEIYSVEMDPESTHWSDAHNEGVEEFLIIAEGTLELTIGEEQYVLGQGDSLRFAADRTHHYHNATDRMIRYHSLIYYT
ncbi:helix-turn-helix domain-containing protein [Cohnella soli]|uniref:Helix-turn-helix domain-containing protein n=1 Tax=Cohnella soli TaxID=425005 RepID=A0ABW0HXG6_9BACL